VLCRGPRERNSGEERTEQEMEERAIDGERRRGKHAGKNNVALGKAFSYIDETQRECYFSAITDRLVIGYIMYIAQRNNNAGNQ